MQNNLFDTINSITLNNEKTWKEKLFLTIDVDWAHDEILKYTIDIIESHKVKATWFITHNTPLLERLQENPNFELGIHPNFNHLLKGEKNGAESALNVIKDILKIVPYATSVRSHHLTQNTYLLNLFYELGLSYECNHFVPWQSEIELKPWLTWNKITKIPYFWEDYISCIYANSLKIKHLKNSNGIKVFNFHPIHIFLNTEDNSRYEKTRSLHYFPEKLKKHRFNGFGINSLLIDLLQP